MFAPVQTRRCISNRIADGMRKPSKTVGGTTPLSPCDDPGPSRCASEFQKVWLDHARATARPHRAIGGALPRRVRVVTGADAQGIDAVRRDLDAIEAIFSWTFSIIADCDSCQRGACREPIVNDGSPSVNFVVFDGKARADAEIDKLMLFLD